MKSLRLAVLASVLATTPLTLAQSQPAPVPVDAQGVPMKETRDADSDRIDLKVDRIPLSDLVDYLSEVTKKNIVLMAAPNLDAGSIVIPPLKLKHVSLEQVLDLVTNIPGVNMGYDTSGEGESTIYILRVEGVENNQEATPAPAPAGGQPYPPDFGSGYRGGAAPESTEPFLSVLPLERMLLGASPAERMPNEQERNALLAERTKQALTLIDQAFAMTPQGQPKPELKLHAETNTLLVRATSAQLQTINQVLSALEVPGPSDVKRDMDREKVEMAREFEIKGKQEHDDFVHELKMRDDQFQRSEMQRNALEKRMQELIQETEQLKAQLAEREAQKANPPQ